MACLELDLFEATIFRLLSEGYSYADVSECIRRRTGQSQGMSSQSIRRYVANRDVRVRSSVDQVRLDAIARSCVTRLGHSYGRRPCKDFYVHKVCALANQDLQRPYSTLHLFNMLLDAMTHIDCLILCHTEQDFSVTSFTWTKIKMCYVRCDSCGGH